MTVTDIIKTVLIDRIAEIDLLVKVDSFQDNFLWIGQSNDCIIGNILFQNDHCEYSSVFDDVLWHCRYVDPQFFDKVIGYFKNSTSDAVNRIRWEMRRCCFTVRLSGNVLHISKLDNYLGEIIINDDQYVCHIGDEKQTVDIAIPHSDMIVRKMFEVANARY